ncbi:hypothetical protein HRK28_19150 [Rathayibacter sp. VKM Ac-2835]|uniref:hypothetical protein n=1 Tax=Rathayibacter sp. VKM Ac-2835 TaxID=2739043 RepID=UPI0015636327|nr:hypothetical protein [Rathayibacter sp. VKM Ac-2835]NRG43030.1 hypothetical protein [Rathayibacter sp. VKM Ac-2835]
MNHRNHHRARVCAAALGVLVLASVAGAGLASAEEIQYGDGEVDVNVDIAELDEPGMLAMSVAGTSTALTETGSTATVRQFTGVLPTVTVTDTREADEISEDAAWYVLGSSSDFTGATGQDPIGAEYFGWTPRMISDPNQEQVSAGSPVGSAVDGGTNDVGLVDQEFLAFAPDSAAIVTTGSWTATADLALRVPSTVESGAYSSILTLSLFETD